MEEIKDPYPYKEELIEYVIKKLGFTQEEFDQIMSAPLKTYHDYPTYYSIIKACKKPLKIAAAMHLIPKILFEKYAKD
ncbi:MAG: hypothetical protein COC01_09945 [Bacteroidetes bacterium]|nr:hypothetical protein [Bacteroidia bacterium]PCH65293.1 MAG: hypothetical protein COC01_09945 [Bacteroidota bacterium]